MKHAQGFIILLFATFTLVGGVVMANAESPSAPTPAVHSEAILNSEISEWVPENV